MSDPVPKLRVIDDDVAEKPVEVLRPRGRETSLEPVQRLPGHSPREVAEKLQPLPRDSFEGRSVEPGVEAILDQDEVAENIERPWGLEEGRVAGIPYGWFVLIILFLVAAGAWSIRKMHYGEKGVERQYEAVRSLVKDDEADRKAAGMLVDRVETVVAAYLAADTIEEILPHVRHADRVKPLIEETLARQPKPSLEFLRMSLFQPAVVDGKPFWIVRAEVRDGKSQSLLIEQTGESEVRVDWETHVCYQPLAWDRYIAERPSGEALDFRVWAIQDSYYSHEFSDSGRWKSFRLTAKGSEDHLFGYAAADGEVAQALGQLCAGSPNQVATVMLRLRVLQGSSSPRGVVIEKIVAPRWLHVEESPKDSP